MSFISRNYGDWASVAVLVFSTLAFVFSKRASIAAKEARDSVLLRALALEMAEARSMSADMSRLVRQGNRDAAQLRIDDLLGKVSYCSKRWGKSFSEESKTNFTRCQGHLLEVSGALSRKPLAELSDRERRLLAKACDQIATILAGEQGVALETTDNEIMR